MFDPSRAPLSTDLVSKKRASALRSLERAPPRPILVALYFNIDLREAICSGRNRDSVSKRPSLLWHNMRTVVERQPAANDPPSIIMWHHARTGDRRLRSAARGEHCSRTAAKYVPYALHRLDF